MRRALAAPIAVGVLGLGALASPGRRPRPAPARRRHVPGGRVTGRGRGRPARRRRLTRSPGRCAAITYAGHRQPGHDDRRDGHQRFGLARHGHGDRRPRAARRGLDRRVISGQARTSPPAARARPPMTITAADVTYAPGSVTGTTGTVIAAAGRAGLLGRHRRRHRAAPSARERRGISSVSWVPTITITPPASAVAGTYTGTITHSVAHTARPVQPGTRTSEHTVSSPWTPRMPALGHHRPGPRPGGARHFRGPPHPSFAGHDRRCRGGAFCHPA